MCKDITELNKYQLNFPLASLIEKDNGLIYQRQENSILHTVIVLKCALHTLGFISVAPKNTKIDIKMLTPNINKWFLQLNED